MFGGGAQPLPAQTVDYGAAIQGLFSGASSLLQNAVLRHVAQQQRDTAERHAQMAEADRQAQLGIAQQREARESQAAQAAAEQRRQAQQNADREFQFKQDQAGKPKRHYDAARGVMVDEGSGVAAPVQNLPPAPTKAGQPHYDERRGVFVHPDGTVTKVQGLPAPQETPSERRAADASTRATAAAARAEQALTLHEKNAAIQAAQTQLRADESVVPRPSKVPARVLGTNAKGQAAVVDNPDRAAATRDSLAFEASTLQPDRARLRATTQALAPAGVAPSAAPASAAPAAGATGDVNLAQPTPGRLRTPARVSPDMQREFGGAADAYRKLLANPRVPRAEAQAAYEADLRAIQAKYRGREAAP